MGRCLAGSTDFQIFLGKWKQVFTAFRCGCGVTVTWSMCQVKEPPADSEQPVGEMPFVRSSIVSVSFIYRLFFVWGWSNLLHTIKGFAGLTVGHSRYRPIFESSHLKRTLSVTWITSVSLYHVHKRHRSEQGPFLTFFSQSLNWWLCCWCHQGRQSLFPGSVTATRSQVSETTSGLSCFLRPINMSVEHFCGRL